MLLEKIFEEGTVLLWVSKKTAALFLVKTPDFLVKRLVKIPPGMLEKTGSR